ncbi:MAG: MFS transporter family glucose-6-phosphate receptor UhpC [Gammaproteobacteria bacterium]|nr:MFS transporter family glucose-6-phosphate receptor UhpC [Gammaproteobacteria bacterium]
MFNFLKTAPHKPKLTNAAEIDSTYKYWRIRIFYSMYIGYAMFYLTRKNFDFIMPSLISDLHLTKSDLGLISTIFYIMYGVSKFVSGILSDKSNPRYFMAIGLIATGVCNIFFGFGASLWFLATVWMVNAFFQGWGWPPCARYLTHWYSQRERGRWWGVWNTSHNLGGGLIPIIAGALAIHYGWRTAMFVPGVIAIGLGLILLNRLRDVPETEGLPTIEEYKNDYPHGECVPTHPKTPTKEILVKYVLCNKYLWILAFSFVLVYIVRTAINDWASLFLTEHGNSLMRSNSAVSFFEIGGFAGSLVAGWASDKIFAGRRGPVNVLFSIGIVAAIFWFWISASWGFIANASALFAIGFLVFGPQLLIGVAAAELSHREAAGTATGFVALFAYIGAALSGYPMGYITQHMGWNWFFVVLGVCSVLTILLLATMWNAKLPCFSKENQK